jgi:hypothetical protein
MATVKFETENNLYLRTDFPGIINKIFITCKLLHATIHRKVLRTLSLTSFNESSPIHYEIGNQHETVGAS